ncbi:MAG TPA: hypothetical protein VD973_10600 [Symbiobacteriaceae bacterium]|nr:hypothetical protein [Symbiobacteriaceae bacterium]
MEQKQPGAFYGANVQGADHAVKGVGDDRPSGSPRRMESTMNIPRARQIPVEGAVTGPEAPPAHVDEIYAQASLDDLDELGTDQQM